MAAVEITIQGMLYDKVSRTYLQNVTIVGNASLTGLGVGGGPIVPPEGGGSEPPLGIWGPTDPRPTHPITGLPGYGPPIGQPPGIWGPNDPRPTPPIYLPPEHVPPEMKPPETPPPGSTAPVPPPSGSSGWPVQPITPPEYVVFNYPGVGPIYVTPPPHAEPAR